jgi:hypothetical protein
LDRVVIPTLTLELLKEMADAIVQVVVPEKQGFGIIEKYFG